MLASISRIGENLICQDTKFGSVVMGQGGNEENIQMCEIIFREKHYRDENGRFVVAIPIKPNINSIGSSRQIALKRFFMLEKRLQRDKEFRDQYIKFMREFKSMEHITPIRQNDDINGKMIYHIPHHGIKSDDKFRVVLDASCKTDKNMSLNDVQLVGERLQRDLKEIIMSFRLHAVALCAEISKMYRQVKIVPEQWDLQRIFWRESPTQPIGEYQINRVIYGMASAAHCAIRAMTEGAKAFESDYPDAVRVINNDFYVDDAITGADSVQNAIKLARDLIFVLNKSGFPLCKWKSNNKQVLKELQGDSGSVMDLNENPKTSVLGLKWLLQTDEFTYEIRNTRLGERLTKRIVLGKIAQLYDPIGFVSPFITAAKIFMQVLWKEKIDWDTVLTPELSQKWAVIWTNIEMLEAVRVPRYLNLPSQNSIQIHGFCDASIRAYGAVVYVRGLDEHGKMQVRVLSAKSRIAPIKPVSVPRLELAACELLSHLFVVVTRATNWPNAQAFFWCDSTVVLYWMRKELCQLKMYVANRVQKIRENTDMNNWFHVRSEQNPADLISRGLNAMELVPNELWWSGPPWLRKPEDEWPTPLQLTKGELHEANTEIKQTMFVGAVHLPKLNDLLIFIKRKNNEIDHVALDNYTNDIQRILRIASYVLRFIKNCKSEKPNLKVRYSRTNKSKALGAISLPSELEKSRALNHFIRLEQQRNYPRERTVRIITSILAAVKCQ